MVDDRSVFIERRPYLRKISMTVKMCGQVRVVAPIGMSLASVIEFVASNDKWITQKDSAYAHIRQKYPRKRYREGDHLPFLGRSLRLSYRQGENSRIKFDGSDTEFIVELPPKAWANFDLNADHTEYSLVIRNLYAEAAKQLLRKRVTHYSRQMGLMPRALKFRAQKTRWGSCTSQGIIALNWRLIVAPLEVIDYVVVHELAHLKHMDHSANFWKLVAEHSPDFNNCKEWLRLNQYEADFLAKRSEIWDFQA